MMLGMKEQGGVASLEKRLGVKKCERIPVMAHLPCTTCLLVHDGIVVTSMGRVVVSIALYHHFAIDNVAHLEQLTLIVKLDYGSVG